MSKLLIEPTKTSPFVCFDPQTKFYEISGQSCPENPNEVFDPIYQWVEANISTIDHTINLKIKADYFNSASNRLLLKLLRILELHYRTDKDIQICWLYEDEEVQSDGTIFEKLVNLPFVFIADDSEA